MKDCEHLHHEPNIPDGYAVRHEWFKKMQKTHKQTQCPECKLWAVWTKKGK